MTVFVVLGGWDYEGMADEPLGVFDSREKADAFVASATGYESYTVTEATVA